MPIAKRDDDVYVEIRVPRECFDFYLLNSCQLGVDVSEMISMILFTSYQVKKKGKFPFRKR